MSDGVFETERDLSARGALQAATDILSNFGFNDPELESRFLLSGLLKVPLTEFYVNPQRPLAPDAIATFQKMVERRCQREPVSYIVGWHQFMGFDFHVDPRALIPRPETEILVEKAVEWLRVRNLNKLNILDLGCGSGCIGVSLARLVPNSQVMALDLSDEALALTKKNAQDLGNITILKSNLFAALGPEKRGYFDMIASNPPYISTSELKELETEIHFEPTLALDGGKDGLNLISQLIKDAPIYLKQNGLLVLEIGMKQGLAVERLMTAAGFEQIEVIKDFQGHDRIVKGAYCGSV